MKKVSIIISVYNTCKYLLRCLDSIKKQTLDNIEVIIVNDGSTDDSEQFCKDYIKVNNLDWRLLTKKNGGLSSARLYGWTRCNGKYVVFIDSDDSLHPDYCKFLYEAIIGTDSDLAICGYNLCNTQNKTSLIPKFPKNVIENIHIDYNKRIIFDTAEGGKLAGFLWMRMMRRDLISEDCFVNENTVFSEDNIFDLKYSESVKKIAVVSKALYNYFINPGSLTLKYRPNMLEMSMNLNDFYQKFLKANNLWNDEVACEMAKLKASGVIAALVNVFRFGNKRDVKNVVEKIRNNQKYNESLNDVEVRSCLPKNQKILWFFIEKHMAYIPYTYYNLRNCLR